MSKNPLPEARRAPAPPSGPTEPYTTRAQLRTAHFTGSAPHREPIGTLLVASGSVHETGVQRALFAQSKHPQARLGELLLGAGEIEEDELYRALSEQLGVPYVRLGEFDVEAAALAMLPQDIARSHRLLPLMFHDGKLFVATDDPANNDKLSALRFRTQRPLEVVLASPTDLDMAIATRYPATEDEALVSEAERLLQQHDAAVGPSVEQLLQEKPIVRLVSNLLLNAVQRRASDIHLHPREHYADVRYRIDGSLVDVGKFNSALLPPVVARIKVLAGMDVAEHRLPQDGALRVNSAHGFVDMRISIMPAVHGENVVIRILDPNSGLRRLADIGFTATDERRVRSLINRNQGLVLVTGPTGSGKTTTLYAALQEMNGGEYHILTVEVSDVDVRECWPRCVHFRHLRRRSVDCAVSHPSPSREPLRSWSRDGIDHCHLRISRKHPWRNCR